MVKPEAGLPSGRVSVMNQVRSEGGKPQGKVF